MIRNRLFGFKKRFYAVTVLVLCAAAAVPVTAKEPAKDVVCNIGSISKTMVTVSVLQLVEQGKINLDKPVTAYIPEFKMADSRYKKITVRMLLNHSSGMMGTTFGDSFLLEDNDTVAHDLLLDRLSRQRLKAEPGEFGVYCNDGFWLAELVVERVSGESFTDYLKNHIENPLGLVQTGTPADMFQCPEAIDIYLSSGDKMGREYVMNLGSGGVISTAPELCKYGTAFFIDDNTLLSEKSKKEMNRSYAKDANEDNYGLGWDSVGLSPFEEAGVKVLEKGGSTRQQFADLIVAPDEKISVAVMSSGDCYLGSTALARVLMDVALQEKGINAKQEKKVFQIVEKIPAEYKQYEGYYSTGKKILKLEFNGLNYVAITPMEGNIRKTEYYKFSKEGKFVYLSGDPEKSMQHPDCVSFEFTQRKNGRTYIVRNSETEYEGLGFYNVSGYYAEKMVENPVSEKVMKAWKEREGNYCMYSGKYSNMMFLEPEKKLTLSEGITGYVNLKDTGICKIIDEDTAVAFVQIPCENGRDIHDLVVSEDNGKTVINMINADLKLVNNSSFETLDEGVKQVVTTKDKAKWYKLGEKTKGMTVSFERSEHTSVYVFDKYGTMVYSNYMLEYPNEVAFPSEGKVLFAGDTGETIGISYLHK